MSDNPETTDPFEARLQQLDRAISDTERYLEKLRKERMEEALRHIQDWCDAYPIEAFPEPDLKAIRDKIGDGPMSALHAHWARHLLSGIARYVQKGLRDENADDR